MSAESPSPATIKIVELQNAAEMNRREAIDRAFSALSMVAIRKTAGPREGGDQRALPRLGVGAERGVGLDDIAEPARGLDYVDAEFLAQAADENLDRVRIAIEILIVEMIDDLAAGTTRPEWCMR